MAPVKNLLYDLLWRFGPGVIVRYDADVSMLLGYLAHFRAFVLVPVPTAAEYRDNPAG